MGLTFAEEPPASVQADPDLPGLLDRYWREAGSPDVPYAPNWPLIFALHNADVLSVFTARDTGLALVGFCLVRLQTALGFRQRLGYVEMLYVEPAHRGDARKFIAFVERQAAADGIMRLVLHDQPDKPNAGYPAAWGYTLASRDWIKDL